MVLYATAPTIPETAIVNGLIGEHSRCESKVLLQHSLPIYDLLAESPIHL